jgi:hypothetical protein
MVYVAASETNYVHLRVSTEIGERLGGGTGFLGITWSRILSVSWLACSAHIQG